MRLLVYRAGVLAGVLDMAPGEPFYGFAYDPVYLASADVLALLRTALFDLLAGNCDAHAKNLSVVWTEGGLRLAPAYDLLSTAVYDGEWGAPLSRSMGMRVGAHSNIDRVDAGDVAALAGQLKVSPRLLRREAERTAELFPGAMERAAREAADAGFDAEEAVSWIVASAERRRGLFA